MPEKRPLISGRNKKAMKGNRFTGQAAKNGGVFSQKTAIWRVDDTLFEH